MLYLRFNPSFASSQLLEELQGARNTLDQHQDAPDAYMGELRRHAIALSVHYSTRIEGNTLTLEQVESLLRGKQVAAPISQQREALNYHEAMQYVQSVAASSSPRLSEDTVKAVHFIVTKSLPGDYNPGRYRSGQNFVVDRATRRTLFRPPPPERVQPLMEEYVRWLNTSQEGLSPYYKAGLAHLNFVAIHPFDDGNGRTARVLEALVLYLAGYKSQELVSLEEYFGLDTQGYYRAIADSLGPSYEPEGRDVTLFVEYYLRAHAKQAKAAAVEMHKLERELAALARVVLDRVPGFRWRARRQLAVRAEKALGMVETSGDLEEESAHRSDALTDRSRFDTDQILGLLVACRYYSITNGAYREIGQVGNQTAAKRLAQMVDAGLLTRHGRGRATHYAPTEAVLRVFLAAGAGDE